MRRKTVPFENIIFSKAFLDIVLTSFGFSELNYQQSSCNCILDIQKNFLSRGILRENLIFSVVFWLGGKKFRFSEEQNPDFWTKCFGGDLIKAFFYFKKNFIRRKFLFRKQQFAYQFQALRKRFSVFLQKVQATYQNCFLHVGRNILKNKTIAKM